MVPFVMSFSAVIQIVLLAGAPLAWVQAFGYAIADRSDRRDEASHWLSILFFCMGCWHLEGSFSKTGWIVLFPGLKFAGIPFVFWTGPLVFFYFRFLLAGRKFRLSREIWHFLPGLLACGVWPYLASVGPELRLRFAQSDLSLDAVVFLKNLNTAGVVVGVIYLAYVLARFVYPGRPYWNPGRRSAVYAFATLVFFALVLEVLRGFELYWKASLFLFSHSVVLLVFLLLRIGRPGIMSSFAVSIHRNQERRSRLANRDRKALREELTRIMKEEALYLNEELSLGDLADYTGVTSAQMSELINGEFGKNFNVFVNEYRIRAAQKRLLEYSGESVLEAGLACGFRSASAFQSLFKAHTGLTPGQFRKKHRES